MPEALLGAVVVASNRAAAGVYADETGPLRSAANRHMQQARTRFRDVVEQAREQYGVVTNPSTFVTVR